MITPTPGCGAGIGGPLWAVRKSPLFLPTAAPNPAQHLAFSSAHEESSPFLAREREHPNGEKEVAPLA